MNNKLFTRITVLFVIGIFQFNIVYATFAGTDKKLAAAVRSDTKAMPL